MLDPEQNSTFTDHYLEQPFDLSEVMFIATANTLETLSPPLRDRMEIVELSGYTSQEKAEIARRHLIQKRTSEAGVPDASLVISDDALLAIINDYTREAGVRQLDREVSRLARALALEVARAADDAVFPKRVVEPTDLAKYLGKPRFHNESRERVAFPGVATGLAWTPFGGDILFIETSRSPGKGRLQITGKLGDVMQESAKAALSFIKSHGNELGVDLADLDASDLHIHVPAGARPQGRAVGRRHDVHCAGLALHRAPSPYGYRHDRRVHVARPRAAGGRYQSEGPRGTSRWHPAHHLARTESAGHR